MDFVHLVDKSITQETHSGCKVSHSFGKQLQPEKDNREN